MLQNAKGRAFMQSFFMGNDRAGSRKRQRPVSWVACPVCSMSVPSSRIHSHVDGCLKKQASAKDSQREQDNSCSDEKTPARKLARAEKDAFRIMKNNASRLAGLLSANSFNPNLPSGIFIFEDFLSEKEGKNCFRSLIPASLRGRSLTGTEFICRKSLGKRSPIPRAVVKECLQL